MFSMNVVGPGKSKIVSQNFAGFSLQNSTIKYERLDVNPVILQIHMEQVLSGDDDLI